MSNLRKLSGDLKETKIIAGDVRKRKKSIKHKSHKIQRQIDKQIILEEL